MGKFIIPTFDELEVAFYKNCNRVDNCDDCRYCEYGRAERCIARYFYDVMTFNVDQNEAFEVPYDGEEEERQKSWDKWCEQLKGGEDAAQCETCKYCHRIGEDGCLVCDKPWDERSFPDCYDRAMKGGAE